MNGLSMPNDSLLIFPSELGWMAVAVAGSAVRRLTFGHRSAKTARKALGDLLGVVEQRNTPLVLRLQSYAAGQADPFLDISIAPGPLTDFQRRVLDRCRHIPYGKTISYVKLAKQAGFPRAARAVGHCMATNRIPLIIPCHRVICTDGHIGNYSAPGGEEMKRRLLAMESRNWPRIK
jgi:methylated-DNA-[protein]-cysteine S-methyltransferase